LGVRPHIRKGGGKVLGAGKWREKWEGFLSSAHIGLALKGGVEHRWNLIEEIVGFLVGSQ